MNPLWGAPRIHGELMKFGIEVAERTVSRLIPRRRSPPSQTWRTFLANHGPNLVSLEPIDWRQQAIIFWGGGLRGALPLILALSLPFDFAERQRILDLTAGVVLFTLLVQGTTVSRLIRSLGPTSGGNPSHTGSVARS
jgi:NhaP-type Na+/H+ or K+/H+ antiporter